ncbi:alpha-1,2-mannosyltransferase [Poronia punctata]|nr:alpha-1,2-mannosyltransferase [Poronia punctata]
MAMSPFVWPLIGLSLYIITYVISKSSLKDVLFRKDGIVAKPGTPGSKKNISDIANTFPPSQRDELNKILSKTDSTFSKKSFIRNLLDINEDYTTADESKYIYSGFSIREIKALGDFPDYATLSGVPLPSPYPEFDIDKALPRPYRPFRWPYHQTMSLSKLEPDWWIELESTYRQRMQQRKALYAQHGTSVLRCSPGTELACKEVMEMAVQFLCARYPQYFTLSVDNRHLENKILDVRVDIRDKKSNPLLILLNHVPEDFALMQRDPETGMYVLRAGVICSALGWDLSTKFGMKLHEIHGPIPDYKEKMQFSMDRYFSKMPTDKPIQRASWGLEVDQPLFMPAGHPHEEYRYAQEPGLERDRLHLRVDWQTLRRLPLSGAVVFNFKAVFTPVSEFRDEPYVPSLMLRVLRRGDERIMKYKNTWHTEHVVIPTLEEYEREQIESGMIEKGWEPNTLEESPYFPGWEKKWHGQQGF